jgi:hypothetical protein
MPDDRRMTFIVVPHGGSDLGTRSFEVSYRRLRLAGLAVVVALAVWVVSMASWVLVAAQAARVPLLKHEISQLQAENARVVQLAQALHRLESRYEQVRQMLGADRDDSTGVWLPPASGNAATVPSPAGSAGDSEDSRE